MYGLSHFFQSASTLSQGFSQLSPSTREYLRRGFGVVAEIKPELHETLLDIATRSFEELGFGTDQTETGRRLQIDEKLVPPTQSRRASRTGPETLAGANAARLFADFEETNKGCTK